MSTSGKYGPLGLDQDGANVFGLSATTLFLVIFKYFSVCVIIKKVEMLLVVLNITAC